MNDTQIKIDPSMFTHGENPSQFYYFFKNEITKELVQIIRNKRESFWFGSYINDKEDSTRLIPVYESEDEMELLGRVCEWYNNGKPEAEQRPEPSIDHVKRIGKTLTDIQNMFGSFPEKSACRIQAFLDDPTVDRWDDISSIIVDGSHTVWQCVIEIDSTFPKSGRSTDITGKIVSEWERIPIPLEVLRAIKTALKKKNK